MEILIILLWLTGGILFSVMTEKSKKNVKKCRKVIDKKCKIQ